MGNNANQDRSRLKRQALEVFGFAFDERGRVALDTQSQEEVARLRDNLIMRPAMVLGAVGLSLPDNWRNAVQAAIDHDQASRKDAILAVTPKIARAQVALLEKVGAEVPTDVIVVEDHAKPESLILAPNCGTLYTHNAVDGLLDQALEHADLELRVA